MTFKKAIFLIIDAVFLFTKPFYDSFLSKVFEYDVWFKKNAKGDLGLWISKVTKVDSYYRIRDKKMYGCTCKICDKCSKRNLKNQWAGWVLNSCLFILPPIEIYAMVDNCRTISWHSVLLLKYFKLLRLMNSILKLSKLPSFKRDCLSLVLLEVMSLVGGEVRFPS